MSSSVSITGGRFSITLQIVQNTTYFKSVTSKQCKLSQINLYFGIRDRGNRKDKWNMCFKVESKTLLGFNSTLG